MADTDKALRGGLRRAVFWPAMELLHRVRLAREGMSSKMSSETGCVVESFLLEQAELFAKLLVQYPCPSPDRVAAAGKLKATPASRPSIALAAATGPNMLARIIDMVTPRSEPPGTPTAAAAPAGSTPDPPSPDPTPSKPEAASGGGGSAVLDRVNGVAAASRAGAANGAVDNAALASSLGTLCELEKGLVDAVRGQLLGATSLGTVLTSLCAEYMRLLRLGYDSFVLSEEFEEVLAKTGPLDRDVARRVDPLDIAEIETKMSAALLPPGSLEEKKAMKLTHN
jgi:hypothetical protein